MQSELGFGFSPKSPISQVVYDKPAGTGEKPKKQRIWDVIL
jgi:hypothetical protein